MKTTEEKTPKWNKTNLQTTTETMEWTNYTKTAQKGPQTVHNTYKIPHNLNVT
jgi:hypothetical protein